MRPFVTPDQMAALDLKTMKSLGLSSWQLMKLVATEMAERFAEEAALKSKVLVLAGPGNNGGDAYCFAKFLSAKNYRVEVMEVLPASSSECKQAKKFWKGKCVSSVESFDRFDYVVDGVFGCRGKARLNKKLSDLFSLANKAKSIRLALDVPSGFDSLTGEIHKNAFQADVSYCVAFPKTGFLAPKRQNIFGKLVFIDVGFVRPRQSDLVCIEDEDFKLEKMSATKHKSGRCAVLAGSSETPGAAFLSAEAAFRTGVGYVKLFFAKPPSKFKLSLEKASFMYSWDWSLEKLKSEDALVVGCGGLPSHWTKLDRLPKPQVWDADVFRNWPKNKKFQSKVPRILTPHPGEAAMLLNWKLENVLSDPLAAAQLIVKKTKQSVYLKSFPAVLCFAKNVDVWDSCSIAQSDYVNLYANPTLGKAGSGDVLSGLMGGFISQEAGHFGQSVINALIFQRTLAEQMRDSARASLSSDQLKYFSQSFQKLEKLVEST